MKKIVTTVMIMICSLFMTGLMNNSVNAGQLDKNESYVLEKISEDKFPAKVQQRYINQLKNYFCQDDISLGKGEAEDFVKYLGEALSEKNGDTPKEMADSYIRFEKAGSAIGLLLSYDSRENVFYFTDSSGYIVLDFQDVVKNTGNEKSGMPTELIFTAIIGLCIIGLLLNLGRWGRKIRRNSDTYEDDEDENELEVANRRTRRARMQTFSYKAVKQILRYCFVPIIMGLIVIGAVMVGMTFFDDITSSVKNNFINTQPVYVESNRQFVKTTVKKDKQKKKIKLSDISTPKYGDQYGEITCDKLQLKAPVYFGDRGNILKKGAGQYNGSFLPGEGETILIGAHDTTYFKKLENVKKGQTFEFTTEYGIYEYKVKDIKIVDEDKYDEAYDLSADKESLVLYTCYPFGKLKGTKEKRMFVYLDKVTGPDIQY